MTAAALLPFLIALPVVGSLLLLLVPNEKRRLAASLAGVVAVAALAIVLAASPAVFFGEVARWRVDWLPQIGLAFGFRMDGLAWLFALIICAIGALVVLYAAYYLHHSDPAARFFAFLLLFKAAMLGVVLADNLLLLVVFWELTSLSSFLLIGYWSHRDDAREGAKMALTITAAGGLCLLAGVLLLGHMVGGFDLELVLASGDTIRAHPLYVPALALILLGAFTKSAQFPFHFWLPHAMAAPTPVSAYLHSATMVKAGVFLLARLYPALGGSEAWFWMVAPVGLATLIIGAWIAIFQHDLKGLLAYSTISHLGLITLLFGIDSKLAVVAAVFHIINHATFKASLFMAAGIIDHECGSRDMRQLNGLARLMPVTATLGIVAASAMAGVPLLNGFLSKEMFFTEAVRHNAGGVMDWLLPAGATLAGLLSVAYSLRFVHDVFFNGEPVGLDRVPHEPPRFMRVPVEMLVALCVAVGVAPALTVAPLLEVAAQAALSGGPYAPLPEYTLALWHGFNLPLAMSLVAMVGGAALYFGLQRRVNLHTVVRLPLWIESGGREAFVAFTRMKLDAARAFDQRVANGSLQRYLLLLVLVSVAFGLIGAWPESLAWAKAQQPTQSAGLPGLMLFIVGCAAAFATARWHRQRLTALVLLGAVGLVVALVFVLFSAPDLALTQLLVEMVTIILMMMALRWLPDDSPPESRPGAGWRRLRDALVAIVAGTALAALAWALLTRPFDSIAQFFLDQTIPLGGGANAVNVILVDFRAYDTLGEITVLGIAALAIHALLAGQRATPALHPPRRSAFLPPVASVLLPLAVLLALHLFLRGHNAPGGGFIAGLVLALGLVLQTVAYGAGWAAQRVGADFRGWIGWGLLIAGGAGIGSFFFAAPFLTSTYAYWTAPLLGPLPLASAMVFDFGVLLTVVGATMVSLQSIARLSAGPAGPARREPTSVEAAG
jgi:multicomponent K+:H+ antiporter subunit A